MKVVWTDSAIDDVALIYEYIARFNPSAAARLARKLWALAESLDQSPERGRPGLEAGTSELLAIKPYILIYQVESSRVVVLRVWHGARDRQDG